MTSPDKVSWNLSISLSSPASSHTPLLPPCLAHFTFVQLLMKVVTAQWERQAGQDIESVAQVSAEEEQKAGSTECHGAARSGVPPYFLPFLHSPHHYSTSCCVHCDGYPPRVSSSQHPSTGTNHHSKFAVRKQWKHHENYHPIDKFVGGPKDCAPYSVGCQV